MNVIIAGSRTMTEYRVVCEAIKQSGFQITEIVCGMAPGVDALGLQYAREQGIPVKEFPADWDRYGRAAGPLRNKAMAAYADALIAVWDGRSKGTASMISLAKQAGIAVFVYHFSS